MFQSGTASAHFAAPLTFTTASGPADLEFGDFNNDLRTDVAVANKTANSISILLGAPIGYFGSASSYSTGSNTGPGSLTNVDINRNGSDDVVYANQTSGTVGRMYGNGLGALGPAAAAFGGVSLANYIWAADLNSDGLKDMMVTRATTQNKLAKTINNGTGGWPNAGAGDNYNTGSGTTNPAGVVAADLNRDGFNDAVVANQGTNNVGILLNDGAARRQRFQWEPPR